MIWLLLVACGEEPEEVESAVPCDSSEVTWEGWGEAFFAEHCQSCHSAEATDRQGAPPGVNYDTWAEVEAGASGIRYMVLESGYMPPGGGVDAEEAEALEKLLSCATDGP